MNILMIISKNDKYGAQRVFLDHAAALQRMGHRVVVVGRGSEGYITESVQTLGIEYHGIPLKGFKDILFLVRLVKKNNVDVIHTYLDRADYFGIIVSRLMRRPVISTMNVRRHHVGYKLVDRVVVVSDKQKELLVSKGVPQNKIRLIRPGIDVDRFAHPDPVKRESWRTKLKTDRYSTVFCHIASLIPRKSHLISLELMAAYKKLGGNPLLVIIGDPLEGEYYESLNENISRLGLKDNVYFTGWTADTAEILSLSHITLLPSENEALGIVLMEGMAAGTPIVAREGEGGAELVEEYGAGFLYNTRDGVNILAEKIAALRHDNDHYRNLSDGCRKKAGDFFSMRSFGEKLIELYRATST